MSDQKLKVESFLRRGIPAASSIEELRAILRKALDVLDGAEVAYGCHLDLEPHMKPDGCVIPEGHPHDCIYAGALMHDGKSHWQCEYWKPVL